DEVNEKISSGNTDYDTSDDNQSLSDDNNEGSYESPSDDNNE
ncbi:16818_t:CDS:1, partial [Dentiscutata erythropus]